MSTAVHFPQVSFQRNSALVPFENVKVNRQRGGAVRTQSNGNDYWQGQYLTVPVARQLAGRIRAFVGKHGGGRSSVLLGHPLECLPAMYASFDGVTRAGGGGFDGTADIFQIYDLYNIRAFNLPSNFDLRAGDRIGIEENGRYSLHMIANDALADAGGSVDIELTMPLPRARTTAAKIRFERPVGEFILEPNSLNEQAVGTSTVFSFNASSRLS